MGFSWRDWVFSAKAFVAAVLAVFVALSLDLPKPYWAMAAVYIVANPLAGATTSKGLYRALGTLLGAAAAVFFVPLFVNAPELLSLVIALWTGTLLFISMLDRTARSYVFMLAGYTLPLIALPTVGNPATVFDTALARTEEITIGIVCASLVSMVVFPVSVRTALSDRISAWLGDAGNWAFDILEGEGASPATPLNRQKLAADVLSLDLMISQLGHDADAHDIAKHAKELRGRLMMLLPMFSSLADRLHALKLTLGTVPSELSCLLHEMAQWLRNGTSEQKGNEVEYFIGEIEKLERHEGYWRWSELLRCSALERLKEIVQLWGDCLSLNEQIAKGRKLGAWHPIFRNRRIIQDVRHYDLALLAFSAAVAFSGTLAASLFWIFTGWQNGAGFVSLTAVACSFFATSDRPAPLILAMFKWTAISLVVAFVYLFGILPLLNSFEMLVIAFAPPFLLLGLLITRQRYGMFALLLAVNSANFIALQDRYSADFTSFANEAIAALGGVGFALVWTLLTRPFGAEIAARRLVKAGWSDLAEMAAGKKDADQDRLAARSLDRLGQLVPRLAVIEDQELRKVDGYADIRLGFNVLMLQKNKAQLPADEQSLATEVTEGVAALYKERSRQGRAIEGAPQLRQTIDKALQAVASRIEGRDRSLVDALVGLRRALFPQDSPPEYLSPDRAPIAPRPIAAE
ncbi:FUSC family protein [Oryzifoliimicrobium ureilyticus]|uniref:FUSC family protein n=1 Tax=Oryzifoliimicrobium ureilyticus TaxID=3113724 RepID=UPI00307635C6